MSQVFQPVETSQEAEIVIEIERSLLNAIVIGDEIFADIQALSLHAEDFSTETHRLIFEAMSCLHDRCEGIDALSLFCELEGTPRPDGEDSWSTFIMNVLGLAVPVGSADFPVKRIKEFSLNRKLSEAGFRLYETARSGDSKGIERWSERIEELNRDRAYLDFEGVMYE